MKEKVIDGILHFQVRQNSDFVEGCPAEITRRYLDTKKELIITKRRLNGTADKLAKAEAELANERARIIELEDLVLKLDGLSVPPCFICGYNGPGYWQPEVHRCAGRHNAVMDRARGEGRCEYQKRLPIT